MSRLALLVALCLVAGTVLGGCGDQASGTVQPETKQAKPGSRDRKSPPNTP